MIIRKSISIIIILAVSRPLVCHWAYDILSYHYSQSIPVAESLIFLFRCNYIPTNSLVYISKNWQQQRVFSDFVFSKFHLSRSRLQKKSCSKTKCSRRKKWEKIFLGKAWKSCPFSDLVPTFTTWFLGVIYNLLIDTYVVHSLVLRKCTNILKIEWSYHRT